VWGRSDRAKITNSTLLTNIPPPELLPPPSPLPSPPPLPRSLGRSIPTHLQACRSVCHPVRTPTRRAAVGLHSAALQTAAIVRSTQNRRPSKSPRAEGRPPKATVRLVRGRHRQHTTFTFTFALPVCFTASGLPGTRQQKRIRLPVRLGPPSVVSQVGHDWSPERHGACIPGGV